MRTLRAIEAKSDGRARFALLVWAIALIVTGYIGYRFVDVRSLRLPWQAASAPAVMTPPVSPAPAAVAGATTTAPAAAATESGAAAANLAQGNPDAQEQRLRSVEEAVSRLGARVAVQTPDERAWRVAELDYLLRIADHRARLERDGAGAAALLDAASELLATIDDRSLDPVRVAVDASRQALANAPAVDVDAIHDRLTALEHGIEAAPAKLPKYSPAAPPSAEAAHDGLTRLLARLGALFDFRTRNAAQPPPLLRADDERYLRLNLMLIVEKAEVAALLRDDAAYHKSLIELDSAVAEYFEPSDDRVGRIRDEIAQLQRLQLSVPLPDLTGALRSLESRATARATSHGAASNSVATRQAP
jgi:uroporphyrin-3 C-methyltransferase